MYQLAERLTPPWPAKEMTCSVGMTRGRGGAATEAEAPGMTAVSAALAEGGSAGRGVMRGGVVEGGGGSDLQEKSRPQARRLQRVTGAL